MYINNFNSYLKNRFGRKMYKISLNAGMTCPNRDGSIDTRGCIFCSAGGSGDFATSSLLSITNQIEEGKSLVNKKLKAQTTSDGLGHYIAYFQAYTNTYAPLSKLESIYMEAANHKDIAAISIATRPDCLNEEIVDLILKVHNIKPVFIELGLQTSNEETANYIRRGYKNDAFSKAVAMINRANSTLANPINHIHIVVHMIIGLPKENVTDMLNTINYINSFPVHGIKLQLLHILKDTDLAKDFEKNSFKVLSMEEYTDILIKLLKNIRPDIVIHRMTGDGPKNILIAPLWSGNKRSVLNYINRQLSLNNVIQGENYTHI